MRSSRKRWVSRFIEQTADTATIQQLAQGLKLDTHVIRLLWQRGYTTTEAIERFLFPEQGHFYDPFLMLDMRKVVDRIRQAILNKQQILVYGDYDADGATSTALMYLGLKKLGARVEYYIPNRFSEGYGLNVEAVKEAAQRGFDLIVTVDNGISAHQEVLVARELGIDLIVTDHHTPPPELPKAYAILNPKQPGCGYPDKMLAGVGVGFKMIEALWGYFPEEMLDLAAIGTIADLAPLVDENRLFAYFGLTRINRQPRVGIQALIQVSGLEGKSITAGHVGFAFGPRINAAGRLESATDAVELLITEDYDHAHMLAGRLHERNTERQQLSNLIFEEAVAEVESHPAWGQSHVLVVAQEGWNAGVIGIVASRLVERYSKPVLMVSISDGVAKGSARSVSGFHLYDALYECKDLFDHFGGHKMAAGFSLPADDIDALRERLNRYAQELFQEGILTEEDFLPRVEVEISSSIAEVHADFVQQVGRMAPFGFGNPTPRVLLENVKVESARTVGKEAAHLQATLSQAAHSLSCVAFRMGEEVPAWIDHTYIDVLGEVSLNEWNGHTRVQIMVEDWRSSTPTSSSQPAMEKAVQIHDLRNHPAKKKWLEEQAATHSLSILTFRPQNKSAYEKIVASYPWQEMKPCQVCRVSDTGEILDPIAYQELVIAELPNTSTAWETLIRSLPAITNLYLLFDEKRVLPFLATDVPDRQAFAGVYRQLQELRTATKPMLQRRIAIADHDLDFILSVFVELGFANQDGVSYHVIEGQTKRELTESQAYQSRAGSYSQYQHFIETWCVGAMSTIEPLLLLWLSHLTKEVHPS